MVQPATKAFSANLVGNKPLYYFFSKYKDNGKLDSKHGSNRYK
jgi:hypothetical protein